MTAALSYPYSVDPNTGVVNQAQSLVKIYLDRVLTLLSTNIGQRPMLPNYGVNWASALFENDNDAKLAIPQAIKTAIKTWLPDIKDVAVTTSGVDYQGVDTVYISIVLPNNDIASLTANLATFNYYGPTGI